MLIKQKLKLPNHPSSFSVQVNCIDSIYMNIQEEVAVLIRAIANENSKLVNLGQLLNVCTVNALGRVLLGRRVFGDGSGGGDAKADEFKSMVVEMMVLAGVFNIGDFIPALEWLDLQGVAAKMKKLHKRFDAFFTTIVEEHKANTLGQHKDLLSTLLSLKEVAHDEGEKLTDTEIKALLLVTINLSPFNSLIFWPIFLFELKNNSRYTQLHT